ncbi:TRAP transporter substrate-binding protein [Vibrio gazogenes]|uniref:Tripartite ATP-independent transporter solute receptor, DctP family n=1 Tax=Vibrio gazogenes DSM 21264 = NBRC 103151 TaxID=1123492 RepID=A0A1M5GZM7_VIBGA|nr:TRAP transporter substrate-binding protein [Vibrio gazogenes]USP15777.1 TRAP transporter substrate-binding protein [Vibrio gazogenes]SHG08882.1 tripartite ATP-independent transporter solute receptor, DctP family [Vibrio gazogenes DSM 21264] [Vibrio gazogenes DSM 21264 = NBRC 103151]SJN52761.1 2,3-diketo-L-gulonate-binding periplasmic protein YiaO precursor [Vibrio gazogenes]
MKRLTQASLLALSILSTAAMAADYTLKLGHVANEAHVWNKAFIHFADMVDQKSNGRLNIDIYPNSQLGSERDVISGIQLGIVDMTMSGETLQNWAPEAALLAVPYAIRDSEHMAKVANGKIGKEIEKQITERTGLVPIAWFERGARNLTSNKPVKEPADLKGLTIRVPNVPIFVSTWSALGAKPTPMAFSEVFTALQQGTVDGQENPLSLIKSASFFEVQKYVNKTEHVRSWIYVLIGKRQLEKLPADLQKILLDSAVEMQAYEHKLATEAETKLVDELKAKGMKFIDVDQDKFRAIAIPAVKKNLKGDVLDLFEQIQQL